MLPRNTQFISWTWHDVNDLSGTESEDAVEIDITVEYKFYKGSPEVRYLRNGDPGYPAEPSEVEIYDVTSDDPALYDITPFKNIIIGDLQSNDNFIEACFEQQGDMERDDGDARYDAWKDRQGEDDSYRSNWRDYGEDHASLLNAILEARGKKPSRDYTQADGDNPAKRLLAARAELDTLAAAGDMGGMLDFFMRIIPGTGVSDLKIKSFFGELGYNYRNGVLSDLPPADPRTKKYWTAQMMHFYGWRFLQAAMGDGVIEDRVSLNAILEARGRKPSKDLSETPGDNPTKRLLAARDEMYNIAATGDRDALVSFFLRTVPGPGASTENVKKFFSYIGYVFVGDSLKEIKHYSAMQMCLKGQGYFLTGMGFGTENIENIADNILEGIGVDGFKVSSIHDLQNHVISLLQQQQINEARRLVFNYLRKVHMDDIKLGAVDPKQLRSEAMDMVREWSMTSGLQESIMTKNYTRYEFPRGRPGEPAGWNTYELINSKGLVSGKDYNWVRDNVLDLAFEFDDYDIQNAIALDHGEEVID